MHLEVQLEPAVRTLKSNLEGYVMKLVVLCATSIILDMAGMRIRCVINPNYCMMVSPIP